MSRVKLLFGALSLKNAKNGALKATITGFHSQSAGSCSTPTQCRANSSWSRNLYWLLRVPDTRFSASREHRCVSQALLQQESFLQPYKSS